MTETKLDRWTQYAAILGALVTAGSMVFGVLTFRRTSEEQRQSMALGVLQDYLKLSVEHPELASFEEGERVDIKHAWFAANALFTAQTLWKLQGDDPRWERIIKAIIRDHAIFLRHGNFACDEYEPEFINYIKTNVPALKCAT